MPSMSSAETTAMGATLRSSATISTPMASPAANTPRGMVTNPQSIPREKAPSSVCSMIPRPTGMLNTTVQPIMVLRTQPDSRPIWSSSARSIAML